MKKIVLSMVLISSMLFMSANTVFAQQTPPDPASLNPADMERVNTELEKALQGLDQLDSIDFDNMQQPAATAPKPAGVISTIETNMMIAAGDGFTLGLKTNDIMQRFNIFVGWDTAGKSIILDTKKVYKAK
jgi:hypothetical protein